MNNVQLIGNLVADAETAYTKNGLCKAKFKVACNRPYMNAKKEMVDNTEFITCEVWGKRGELAGALRRGEKVCVIGRITNHSYEGKDGVKKYFTSVTCDEVFTALKENAQEVSAFAEFGSPKDEEIPF